MPAERSDLLGGAQKLLLCNAGIVLPDGLQVEARATNAALMQGIEHLSVRRVANDRDTARAPADRAHRPEQRRIVVTIGAWMDDDNPFDSDKTMHG